MKLSYKMDNYMFWFHYSDTRFTTIARFFLLRNNLLLSKASEEMVHTSNIYNMARAITTPVCGFHLDPIEILYLTQKKEPVSLDSVEVKFEGVRLKVLEFTADKVSLRLLSKL